MKKTYFIQDNGELMFPSNSLEACIVKAGVWYFQEIAKGQPAGIEESRIVDQDGGVYGKVKNLIVYFLDVFDPKQYENLQADINEN